MTNEELSALIAEWMGATKAGDTGTDEQWGWCFPGHVLKVLSDWNPVANPADCAMVMEKLPQWTIETAHTQTGGRFRACVILGEDEGAEEYAESWTEAFCLAVKAAIEEKEDQG